MTLCSIVLFKVVRMTPFWKMYRGLTPHKIMPMPGTHNCLNLTHFSFATLTKNAQVKQNVIQESNTKQQR